MARNVVGGLAGLVALRLTGLIALPVLVRELGLELYGVWAIADLMLASQGLFDGGALAATVRFVARADAEGNRAEISRVIRLSLMWYTAIGILFAVLVTGLVPALMGRLSVRSADRGQAAILLYSTIGLFTLSNYAFVFGSALQGLQRASIVNLVHSASRGVYVIALLVGALMRAGAAGIVVATGAMYLVQLVGLIAVEGRTAAEAPSDGQHEVSIREFFSFGLRAFMTTIADFGVLQAPRLAGALIGGAQGTAVVDLAYRLPTVASGIAYAFGAVVVPAATHATSLGRGLGRLTEQTVVYLTALATGAYAVLFISAPALLGLLTGVRSDEVTVATRILVLGFLVYTISTSMDYLLTGLGHPQAVAKYRLSMFALTAFGLVIGAASYRVLGIACGSSIAMATVSLLALYVYPPVLHADRGRILRILLKGLVAGTMAVSVGSLVDVLLRSQLGGITVATAACVASYLIAVLATRLVTFADARRLLGVIAPNGRGR